MIRLLTAPSRLLRRLRGDRRGLALIEFAYILPIFVTLTLTGAELTNFVITRMRISQIALQIADNAARMGSGSQLQAKTVTEADIYDIMLGALRQAGTLNLFGNGRVMISSVEPMASPNSDHKYKIGWRRCFGRKAYTSPYTEKKTDIAGGVGPEGRQVDAPDHGATMFVEIAYTYQPLLKLSFFGDNEMREIASMMVRDRRDLTAVYNPDNWPAGVC